MLRSFTGWYNMQYINSKHIYNKS
uniref:Uncharacterized protein n=1 Tax=Rhizophora mucronata TaxID=61149 RepID=A0A2P2NH20_RHIMU